MVTVAHHLVAGGFTDDLVLIDPRERWWWPMPSTLKMRWLTWNITLIFVNDYEAPADADVVSFRPW